MMALTREASDRLNQYLDEMRASLRGSTTIDVAEVEQDIRDHIGAELADRPSPVSADELNTVLSRLGTPGQWGADPAQPATPVSSSSVFGGSLEDRLCYASAGSMLLFLVFPPLLIVSWLLARWTLARIEERGEPLGARRWLLYPPIAIVVAPLGVIALLWAFAPFAEVAGRFYRQPRLFLFTLPQRPRRADVRLCGTGGLLGLSRYVRCFSRSPGAFLLLSIRGRLPQTPWLVADGSRCRALRGGRRQPRVLPHVSTRPLMSTGTRSLRKLTARPARLLAELHQDVVFGLRLIARSPGFSAIAVLTLALTIGANTAVFTVVNALLFRPLPVTGAHEVMRIQSGESTTSWPNYEDIRRRNNVFSDVAAHRILVTGLATDDRPLRLTGEATSANFLNLLGVSAAIGRTFTESESRRDLVVLADHVWRGRVRVRSRYRRPRPGADGTSV